MTQEEFIKVLKRDGYSYDIEGDKIVVLGVDIWLESLTSIPSGVVFKNKWGVDLRSLTSISPGVVFNNGGYIGLGSLTSLPRVSAGAHSA